MTVSRQSFLGSDAERILHGARVAIVGLCGGGSHVAQQLAHIGVGEFLLLDFDRVEASNLNRMVGGRPEDARDASLKVEVIARCIRQINPQAVIHTFSCRWQEKAEWLRDCAAVFGCVDGFSARRELEAHSRRYLTPYIDVGMDVSRLDEEHVISGQVITSLPGRPCMWCMGFLTEEVLAQEAAAYGAAGPRPQVVWPNGILASIAVGTFMQLVTPWHRATPSLYLELDGNLQSVRENPRTKLVAPACPHYSTESVGDPFWG